jgi:hypothetical protein
LTSACAQADVRCLAFYQAGFNLGIPSAPDFMNLASPYHGDPRFGECTESLERSEFFIPGSPAARDQCVLVIDKTIDKPRRLSYFLLQLTKPNIS